MTFSPALSRLICRRGLAGTSGFLKSPTLTRRITTATASPAPIDSVIPSPWLMLPPSFNADATTNYNFYSLAENSVRSFPQTELTDFGPDPTRDVFIRGSSHGWLAIFNRENPDVFLYDPISLRRINLPPIHNLPKHPTCNTFVDKLILSSSPDDDENNCQALMICNSALFFCSPGRSSEWTPIGKTTPWNGSRYDDIVYSPRRNLFFALDNSTDLEIWDLSSPASPRKIEKKINTKTDKKEDDEKELSSSPRDLSYPYEYLAVVDELFSDDEDDVLLLTRRVLQDVEPDGSLHNYFPDVDTYPQVTIDFDIGVYDLEDHSLWVVESLGDRAVFIGSPSEAVALSTTRFPELKPDSIYFTDVFGSFDDERRSFGGHDIGIFDYGNKTVSPCYYPCDVRSFKRIWPSPVWFHPRGSN